MTYPSGNLAHTPQYHIFVLRLWQEQDAGWERDPLRVVLEDPRTGQRHSFHSIVQLLDFLESVAFGGQA